MTGVAGVVVLFLGKHGIFPRFRTGMLHLVPFEPSLARSIWILGRSFRYKSLSEGAYCWPGFSCLPIGNFAGHSFRPHRFCPGYIHPTMRGGRNHGPSPTGRTPDNFPTHHRHGCPCLRKRGKRNRGCYCIEIAWMSRQNTVESCLHFCHRPDRAYGPEGRTHSLCYDR